MSKGLDLIMKQQPEIIDGFPTGNFYISLTKEELTELEKELKALEIIRYKNISIECLKRAIKKEGLEWYNSLCPYQLERLTQKEYDLLKEVLL